MPFRFSQMLLLLIAFYLFGGPAVSGQTAATEETEESRSQPAFHWLELRTSVNGQALGTSRLDRLNLTYQMERHADVERETVQVDAQTVRTVERLYRRDANGRRKLQDMTEVEQRTFPDGRVEAVQTRSMADVNGRMQVWRQQRQEMKNLGKDAWETSSTVLKPGINGRLETVYRMRQTERKNNDEVVQIERIVEEANLNNRWNVIEQRTATVQEKEGEQVQQETVYELDAFGELSLKSQISSIEWEDQDGGIHKTIDTYQPDSRGRMEVVERIELSEVTLSDGSKKTVQELQTRSSAQGTLQIVERVGQDLTKSRSGATAESIRIERRDFDGKMSTAETFRRTQREKETGPGSKSFTSQPD